MYSDQIKILGLSMFLGLSCGKWFPEHIPTVEEPYIRLVYKGKERHGRPMKILNAAARPPKKYRFTQYFNTSECKLFEQTIELRELRGGVAAEDVVEAFEDCMKNAEQVLLFRQHNAMKAQRADNDPNRELRRTVKRLMKQILGVNFRLSMSREDNHIKVAVSDGGIGINTTGNDEREALINMVSTITTRNSNAKPKLEI